MVALLKGETKDSKNENLESPRNDAPENCQGEENLHLSKRFRKGRGRD